MQKVAIDTNVIVSSLLQRSYPYQIMYELFVDDKFELCISDQLLQEYYDVLARAKFARFPDFLGRAESLLADIESKAKKFTPQRKIDIMSDKDDNLILELADECSADFIITGNTNDFTFSDFGTTKIVSPRAFWELYQGS